MASILSDALHFLFERLEAEICVFRATFKVTERESVDLQPPTPLTTNVSYLWELMSDGLTWGHPWQIEMTPTKLPLKQPPRSPHSTSRYHANVLTIH